jgi:hypothetical protein
MVSIVSSTVFIKASEISSIGRIALLLTLRNDLFITILPNQVLKLDCFLKCARFSKVLINDS